ncbi:GyrI-like domain-containing protein [Aquimarina rhabdastrellae]
MQHTKIEPFKVIGITVRTTNENGKAAQDIPALWNRFVKEKLVRQIPNRIDDTVYGMYTDYESDYKGYYTTIIGCKVSELEEIPEGMEGKSFEGGMYIKITGKGDLNQGVVFNEWMKIWEMDKELNRSYTVDFEVYDQRAQNPNDAEVDILVAVKE